LLSCAATLKQKSASRVARETSDLTLIFNLAVNGTIG
jgi:hypothetical protein